MGKKGGPVRLHPGLARLELRGRQGRELHRECQWSRRHPGRARGCGSAQGEGGGLLR